MIINNIILNVMFLEKLIQTASIIGYIVIIWVVILFPRNIVFHVSTVIYH